MSILLAEGIYSGLPVDKLEKRNAIMPYIIDGNNLIGSSPDIGIDDPQGREKLIVLVEKYQNRKKNNIILVFDGEPKDSAYETKVNNKLKVVYPRYGESADITIKNILDDYNNFKDVVLITSDRELKTFAKKKGAKTVNSIEFYYELKRVYKLHNKVEKNKKKIDIEVSSNEVDHWMKIFSNPEKEKR
jgi:predicted RNA-binding protein with PIN domain